MDTTIANWLNQIVFGLIQGLAEVFPVSSSAHIAIGQVFWRNFAGPSTVTFSASVFFHLGTFLAILIFYQRDVLVLWRSAAKVILHWPRKWATSVSEGYPLGQRTPFLLLLSLGTTGVLGLFLRGVAQDTFGEPLWSAAFLVANGVVLLATAWYIARHPVRTREIADLNWWHFVLIGAAQGLAVVPGLSRFGMTLVVGLLCGLGWYHALKLSFLVSLPTVLAAAALEFYQTPPILAWRFLLPLLTAIAAACLGAFMAIRLVRREGLHAPRALTNFGIYCFAGGLFYFLYIYWLG